MPVVALTVIVAVPADTPLIVIVLPDIVAVATPVVLELTLSVPSPLYVTVTVSELPSVGEGGKIYLVPAEKPESGNLADE